MSLCKVKGKVVYHIHDGNWRVGETYHIGEKKTVDYALWKCENKERRTFLKDILAN